MTFLIILPYSGKFSPGKKNSPNLAQWYCAKFSPDLFRPLPNFCPEEFQPFVNAVSEEVAGDEYSMERECYVRGYHVYIDVWDAAIGEELDCQREPSNANDRYAVAVVDGSDDERGPAGSGSSPLRRGKTVM